jgi:hypothetical protein
LYLQKKIKDLKRNMLLETELYNLRKKLSYLADQVDIISDAPLSFLRKAAEIEALPKDSSIRANIALKYLIDAKDELARIKDGIVRVKSNKQYFYATVDYGDLTTYLDTYKKNKFLNTSVWRTLYLMINTIPADKERMQATWFEHLAHFSDNSILEFATVRNVPGVAFKATGSAHGSLDSGWGKGICDFVCTRAGLTLDGEFKRPTKNVCALAAHAYKNPGYIYNAKILYTYGPYSEYNTEYAFYEIDYTRPDYNRNRNYTITKLGIPFDNELLFNKTVNQRFI